MQMSIGIITEFLQPVYKIKYKLNSCLSVAFSVLYR